MVFLTLDHHPGWFTGSIGLLQSPMTIGEYNPRTDHQPIEVLAATAHVNFDRNRSLGSLASQRHALRIDVVTTGAVAVEHGHGKLGAT